MTRHRTSAVCDSHRTTLQFDAQGRGRCRLWHVTFIHFLGVQPVVVGCSPRYSSASACLHVFGQTTVCDHRVRPSLSFSSLVASRHWFLLSWKKKLPLDTRSARAKKIRGTREIHVRGLVDADVDYEEDVPKPVPRRRSNK